MSEGWTRHLKGDQIESYSAGIEAHGLNPDAVRVNAHESCPVFPGKTRGVHASFSDPPRLAANAKTENE